MPALIFDLDGTLVDSVYEHVLAWRRALERGGIRLSAWRVHRHIGMSGGLLAKALAREAGREVSPKQAEELQGFHADEYSKMAQEVRLLPGARELLDFLTSQRVLWTIATSGRLETAKPALKMLAVPKEVPIVTRDEVGRAKPDPDLFILAAQKLKIDIQDAIIIGDSVWDLLAARRSRALGVGMLAGGYGEDELVRAGAYRVYENPADLLSHINELGIRSEDSADEK